MAAFRTFVAFDTPSPIRDEMLVLQRDLAASGADVRWESPDKFHVTVKFIGNIDEGSVGPLGGALRSSLAPFGPFEAVYASLGCFPDKRRPRVIWVGCTESRGILLGIKEAIDAALLPFGVEIEERAFHPHITLGRVKSDRGLRNLTPMLERCTFEPRSARIERLDLMRSVLRPQGAQYSILQSIHLQSAIQTHGTSAD